MYYESFKYIHLRENNTVDAIESKYKSIDELDGKFITYSRETGYRIYPNAQEFYKHLISLTHEERIFHEVIFKGRQKLKFDIDAKVDKIEKVVLIDDEDQPTSLSTNILHDKNSQDSANINSVIKPEVLTKYKIIFASILRAIKDAFFTTFGMDLKPDQIIICESQSSINVPKCSNHVIIDGYYVNNNEQTAEFTRKVVSFLPREYNKFIDMSVNKRIQNFRIVKCHKDANDHRVKVIVSGQDDQRSFITAIDGCKELPDIVAVENIGEINNTFHKDDVDKILDICHKAGLTTDHKFKCINGGLFIFNRRNPSYCDFCLRVHDKDNTLMISTSNFRGLITVFKQCRKFINEHGKTGSHFVPIGEFLSNINPISCKGLDKNNENCMGETVSWVEKWIANYTKKSHDTLANSHILFDDLPPEFKHVYDEPALRPLELTKTLVVHAMMKMGKTKAMREYLNKYFPTNIGDPIIRFISFRQTFSGNIKEKFADFTLYSEIKGPLTQSKLIVQVESLWRLDIREGCDVPDLLILDECESIFEQFDSGLLRNFSECFAKFRYLINYSKHVICMDANISDRTFRLLRLLRPNTTQEILYHCNRYKNAVDDNYYLTGDKAKWLGILHAYLELDERVAIPITSLTEAKILVKNLTAKYPNKTIKLYSSETPMSEKREHFSDVDTYWSQYDILVYTPTISAGVSFEEKHFHKIFGYFTDQSCPVETCIQMIGRIRDVANKQFYIYIDATGNNLPVEIDLIKQQLYDKRENLIKNFDEIGLQIEYNIDGKFKYHTSPYFYIWLENTRIKNLSKNSFIQRLIQLVSFTGANVHHLTDEIFSMNTGFSIEDVCESLLDEHSVARVEVRADTCKKIADARELNDQEVEDIHSAIVAQQDITQDDKNALDKYRLRVDYRFGGIIDEKFVDRYHNRAIRRIFKNITRISADPDVEISLKQIQTEEAANYNYIMSLDERYHYQDINRKYVFDQHRYALGLLKLCGWKNIQDPEFIHLVTFAQNLRSKEHVYWELIKPACVEFQIKFPSAQTIIANKSNNEKFVHLTTKPIKKILYIMYGIRITSKKNDPAMFFLQQNTLFTYDPVLSNKLSIPLIVIPKKI